MLFALLLSDGARAAPGGCVGCHGDELSGANDPHAFLGGRCQVCHRGNQTTSDKEEAHVGLISFPGLLDNAPATCGGCHPKQVRAVTASLMHSGKGMVNVTRFALREQPTTEGEANLSGLGASPADSLLRKLCASCHLGQPKRRHTLDPLRDRGGGCLACHVNAYPEPGHPVLSTQVEDARCFGCHSRSGRIALSYAGLAEIDEEALGLPGTGAPGRLPDGRLVERRAPDLHHRAGMACIDCHTAAGVMGAEDQPAHRETAVDIQCSDCHANREPRVTLTDLGPASRRLPFPARPDQEFLVTARQGTLLRHIRVGVERNLLYPKLGGPPLVVPTYTLTSHPPNEEHRRLSCQACHSTWAPQCYGCHLEYTEQGEQWDHADSRASPGVWHESRWLVRNGLPPLGVSEDGRIFPHVPGMIFTLEHPQYLQPLFRRLFSPLDPHTSGPSRGCPDCHADPVALGLGQGGLHRTEGGWRFIPTHEPAADGLPADAWTRLDGGVTGGSTRKGNRPFSPEQLRKTLDALPPPSVLGIGRPRSSSGAAVPGGSQVE